MVTIMTETRTEQRSTPWGWIILIWTAIGLIDACQTVLFVHTLGQRRAWLPVFGVELASWLPWLLATPLISGVARRYALTRGTTLATVAIHLAAFAAISVVAEAWYVGLQLAFNPWDYPQRLTFVDVWRTSLPYQGPAFLIVYGLIVTVTLVIDARDNMARKTTEAARLSEELSRAQLAALRRQVEPHFMFNTLNSIAGLVRDHRNDAAVSMIVGLSEFLRGTLQDSDRSEVTLAEEVAYLQRYLDIQKARFGNRLQVSVDIPEELLRAQVPNLLLQPLVENAIKHGIAKRIAGGTISIAGARCNGSLRLTVYNDSPGLAADWQATNTGVGIGNLRTRLQILHADKFALELRSADPGGVEAVVTLPFSET
jgi:two-component system, LytTR family, sensor kinase